MMITSMFIIIYLSIVIYHKLYEPFLTLITLLDYKQPFVTI